MKIITTSFLLLLILFGHSQTRRLGKDTLALTKDAMAAFADSSFQANLNASYCIELDATESIDEEVPDLEYNWTIDRIHKTKGVVAEHCFKKHGKHLVSLSIYDPKIDQMVLNDTVFYLDVPAALRFKKGGFYKILNTVTFSAADYKVADNSFLLWSFGDGSYSSGNLVRNVYFEEGMYDVELYEVSYTSDSTVVVNQAVKDIIRIETNR